MPTTKVRVVLSAAGKLTPVLIANTRPAGIEVGGFGENVPLFPDPDWSWRVDPLMCAGSISNREVAPVNRTGPLPLELPEKSQSTVSAPFLHLARMEGGSYPSWPVVRSLWTAVGVPSMLTNIRLGGG